MNPLPMRPNPLIATRTIDALYRILRRGPQGVLVDTCVSLGVVVAELGVGVTIALPQGHGATGLFHDPGTEVFVGHEQEIAIFGRGVDDFDGVAAGADDVAEGFHFRAAINIGDGIKVGIGGLKFRELWSRAALLQGTTGVLVGQHDDFVGVQNLRGFGHEMDAAKNDDVGTGLGGLLGEAEGIADEIGDVLDFGDLIVVSEDDGVEFFLERKNFTGEGIELRARHGFADFQAVRAARVNFDQINHWQNLTSVGRSRNVKIEEVNHE